VDYPVLFPCGPVASITSVAYIDESGTAQSLVENTDYTLDKAHEPARIYPVYGTDWPDLRNQRNAVTITYVAGYGLTGSTVPAPLVDAMYLLIGDAYEFKQTAVLAGGALMKVVSPVAFEALCAPYRIIDEDDDAIASDTVSAEPSAEPILLADARSYLGIPSGFTDRDAEITRIIKAARITVENATGRALITQTRVLKLDEWPQSDPEL